MYGAKELAAGKTLYLDFWDAKQPGVYMFYLSAGVLFGFTPIGLHLMETIWFAMAAWCAYRLGKSASPDGLAPLVIPVLSAGTYFASVGAWHMSQPDGLMATPVVASIWALCDRQLLQRWTTRKILAGFFAGVAATFKVTIILVPFAAVIAILVWHNSVYARERASVLLAHLGVWLLAAAVPIVVMGAWFWSRGALSEFIWTSFRYPLTALVEVDHHPIGLRAAIIWFGTMTFLWLPFVALGAWWSLRSYLRGNSAGLPGLLMVLWGFVGFLTIFMQYHYWWAFHFNQFFIPMGVLAGIGLGVAFGWLNSRTPIVTAAILAVSLLTVVMFSMRITSKVLPLAQDLKDGQLLTSSYADRFNPSSRLIMESVSNALGDKPDGSLYVFGDPRFLLASERAQAVPHNGWALEIMTASQWAVFAHALIEAHPDYIYLSGDYDSLLRKRAPQVREWLESEYQLFSVDSFDGGWFQHK
jgi:phage shock protein PspC (stress-responsive transcriptional regulator)